MVVLDLIPFFSLISATVVLITDCGIGCHVLKYVLHIAFPAVPPLINSDRSNVSEAGTSPKIIAIIPFWSTFNNLPLLLDRIPATVPICSWGHFTSIPNMGSNRTGSAINIGPEHCSSCGGQQLCKASMRRVLMGHKVM